MARQGDVIENPRRREKVRLVETAAESRGERLVMAVTAEPTDVAPPIHMHPRQTETFKITRGRLTHVLGGSKPKTVGPQEVVVVEPGVSHTWWNAGPETLELIGRLEPAGRFQIFIETIYGLIRDGKVTSRGIPNPLQMAVIAREFRTDVVFTAILDLPNSWLYPCSQPSVESEDIGPGIPAYSDPDLASGLAAISTMHG